MKVSILLVNTLIKQEKGEEGNHMAFKNHLSNIEQIMIDALKTKEVKIEDLNCIKFSEAGELNGKFKKVAFDVYKVENDPYKDLWILEDIEGVSHLVRASDPKSEKKTANDWAAVSNSRLSDITLLYKDAPIARFSSSDYGFSPEDIFTFKSALLDVVSEDDSFVSTLFKQQPKNKIRSLVASFPELTRFVK